MNYEYEPDELIPTMSPEEWAEMIEEERRQKEEEAREFAGCRG